MTTDGSKTEGCPAADKIGRFVAGTLESDEAAKVEGHAAGCADCRAAIAIWARLGDSPRGSDEDERAIASLASETRPFAVEGGRRGDAPLAPRAARPAWLWPLALAASVLVASVAGYLALRPQDHDYLGEGQRELARVMETRRPAPMRLAGAPYAEFRGTRGDASGGVDAARTLLRAAADEDRSVATLRPFAWSLLAAGDARGAVAALDAALAIDPDDADLLVDRAVASAEAGDTAAARRDLDLVLARDPGRADALFNRALLDEREGRPEDARAAWERYLAVDPSSEWAAEARRALRGASTP